MLLYVLLLYLFGVGLVVQNVNRFIDTYKRKIFIDVYLPKYVMFNILKPKKVIANYQIVQ